MRTFQLRGDRSAPEYRDLKFSMKIPITRMLRGCLIRILDEAGNIRTTEIENDNLRPKRKPRN